MCISALALRHSSAARCTGWMTPVSLFANIMLTRAVGLTNNLANDSKQITPWESTGIWITSNPSPASFFPAVAMAGCSIAEIKTCTGWSVAVRPESINLCRPTEDKPNKARLSLSVPPLVNTNWSVAIPVTHPPSNSTICRRCCSSTRRELCPSRCWLAGFTWPTAKHSVILAATSASKGEVELWSR